jgi:hypothetical protein
MNAPAKVIPFPILSKTQDLGQLPIIDKFFKDFAKKATGEAGPAVRNVIGEERAKIAQALLNSLPYVGVAGVAAVLTSQFMPPIPFAKTAGYAASLGIAGFGYWKAFSALKTPPPAPPKAADPTPFDSYINSAVSALVTEADPKVKALVDEERKRIAAAGKAGLPYLVGSGAAAILTYFLMPDVKLAKTGGYVAAVGLGAAGLWILLDRLK